MALKLSHKVTIQDWLAFKPYETFTAYDTEFLKVANKAYSLLLEKKDFFADVDMDRFELIELACALTSYLEDYSSEIGLWQVFVEHNQRYLGRPLPFYDLTEYDPDYLNWQDIAYQIWHYVSKHYEERTLAPDLPLFVDLATALFDLFEDCLEDMYSTDFYKEYFQIPDEGMDFFVFKEKLKWLGLDSYLIGMDGKREHALQVGEVLESHPTALPDDLGKFIYGMEEDMVFLTRSSFGGLSASEWFAKIAACSDQKRQEIENLQYRHSGDYSFEGLEGDSYFLFRHLLTKQTYRVRQDSAQMKNLRTGENTIYTLTLLQWNGDWWISGIILETEVTEDERETYLRKPFSQAWMYSEEQLAKARQNIVRMGEDFRAYFGGPLAFFDNAEQLNEANQKFMDSFVAKADLPEETKEKQKRFKDLQQDLPMDDFSDLVGADGDMGLFFAEGQGLVVVSGIKETIRLLEAEKLTREEETDLFVSLANGYPPAVANYLIEHYPTRNIRYPVGLSQVDGLASLPFWWRFYEPDEFGPVFPLVTMVDLE